VWRFKAQALVDGALVAEAEVSAVIVDTVDTVDTIET
jgi:3-hydroxyacyl-[acyl-carrier-protein] dehydratase